MGQKKVALLYWHAAKPKKNEFRKLANALAFQSLNVNLG